MKPRRYQLRKEAVGAALRHPWVFRDHMSSAANVFRDGDWLALVDGSNRVIGHGSYEIGGAIAIRVLRRGVEPPNARWLRGQLAAAIKKRAELASQTDALRLVHGESDGIPAVVVDRFADTIVISSYSAGSDALARYIAHALPSGDPIVGPAANVVIRPAHLRRAPTELVRVLRGELRDVVHITESGLPFAVDLAAGQKTGTYLDLRGLRRALAATPLANARVLNLFAYTGMLGRVAEAAGAAAILQVDSSPRALGFAAAHHVVDPTKHTFVTADVFEWLPGLDPGEQFDLVVVDPPSMTTKATQVPQVLAAYRKLYRTAGSHVRPGGILVAACCTSRIERAVFEQTVRGSVGPGFTLDHTIPPEPDHPVGFPQADYLKIGWWTRGM